MQQATATCLCNIMPWQNSQYPHSPVYTQDSLSPVWISFTSSPLTWRRAWVCMRCLLCTLCVQGSDDVVPCLLLCCIVLLSTCWSCALSHSGGGTAYSLSQPAPHITLQLLSEGVHVGGLFTVSIRWPFFSFKSFMGTIFQTVHFETLCSYFSQLVISC